MYDLDPNLYAARLKLMTEMKQKAREITLPLFHAPHIDMTNKAGMGSFDPVTQADKEAEALMRHMILSQFSKDHIDGEEFPDHVGESDWKWTLDPIDGTRAFLAGVPVWSTLIALSYKDDPIIGMIDLPAMGRTYEGGPNGAWLEDIKGRRVIKTRPCPTLKAAILGCTEPLSMFSQGERAAYEMIRSGIRFSRLGLDALGYGLVAQGRMDIIIEAGLKPCDVRALIPIIHGAGGRLTNWHGGSAVDGGQVVAVGDEGLLPELYSYLARAMPE